MLEEAITKLTAVIEKQNELTAALLSKAGAAPKAEPAAAEPAKTPPKAEPAKTAAKAEPAAPTVTVETLDAKLRPWLSEFDKDHAETIARKEKFKEVLTKLGAPKMSAIDDPAKLAKIDVWFETKMKVAGRLVPDAEAAPAEEEL